LGIGALIAKLVFSLTFYERVMKAEGEIYRSKTQNLQAGGLVTRFTSLGITIKVISTKKLRLNTKI